MFTLSIETSCDDTSCAIVENGWIVHSNVIDSSLNLHKKTGGVVPEVAARAHLKAIIPVISEAISMAFPDISREEQIQKIDQIAVTSEPGLVTSLLVGLETAKTLSYIWDKPLVQVNHIRGHIYSNWLGRNPEKDPIRFPIICLSVSGGHNDIIYQKSHSEWEIIGKTNDDAVGEAFDKVARMLGLGYPGGPVVESYASNVQNSSPTGSQTKNPNYQLSTIEHHPSTIFPRAWLNSNNSTKWDGTSYDFSFSGLKSEVMREINRRGELTEKDRSEIAFAFQEAVCDVLATKLIGAAKEYDVSEIHLAGGVSANKYLRTVIKNRLKKESLNLPFRTPVKMSYCTDNAAMIAVAAVLMV